MTNYNEQLDELRLACRAVGIDPDNPTSEQIDTPEYKAFIDFIESNQPCFHCNGDGDVELTNITAFDTSPYSSEVCDVCGGDGFQK